MVSKAAKIGKVQIVVGGVPVSLRPGVLSEHVGMVIATDTRKIKVATISKKLKKS